MNLRFGVGVALVVFGIMLGLQRFGVIGPVGMQHVLPLTMIAFGVVSLLRPGTRKCRSGGWLVVIGGVWLLSQFQVLWFYQILPLLLVAAGTSIVWRHFLRRSGDHGLIK